MTRVPNNIVKLEVNWRNVPSLQAYVGIKLPYQIKLAMINTADRVADIVVEGAKRTVPIGTPESTGIPGYKGGSLQKSIRKERWAMPKGNIVYTRIRAGGYVTNPNTGRKVHYAKYVEYGTRYMGARPYMRPNLRWGIKKFPDIFWEELARIP